MKTRTFHFIQFMRAMRGASLLLFLSACIILQSCRRDDYITSPRDLTSESSSTANLGNPRSVDVMGIVTDEAGNPVSGAVVRAGFSSQTFTTDERGYFELRDIAGYDALALVRVTKEGYFSGSRSFIPTNGMNKVRIALLAQNSAGSFNAETGGTVSLENVTITFPPNAIALHGDAYAGSVSVSINYIDPSNTNTMYNEMPGNLYGLRNGVLDVLKSYGMAGVELHDVQGNVLQIAGGATAEVEFIVPASLLDAAPDEIALWHYSEQHGYWMQEGVASLEGNHYVAEVSHFSFWNCDDPINAVQFTCTLFDATHSAPGTTPMSGVFVELVSENNGSTSGITDNNGVVSGYIPANEELVLNVFLMCGNTPTLVYSQVVGPFANDGAVVVSITELLGAVSSVGGTLQNSAGEAVAGVVFINDWDFIYTSSGNYSMLICTDNGIIEGWYSAGVEYCYSDPISMTFNATSYDVDIICNSCDEIFTIGPTVTGNDGEQYPTVVIGNQEWFAINLHSSSYANGDAIAQVVNSSDWVSATQGGWCYYDNNPSNDAVYGKLYNWLTTVDSRNVCPTGYHVPTDNDWNQLKGFLQAFLVDSTLFGGSLKATGTLENFDGLWNAPNTNATNLTLFKALPGGSRFSSGGYYNMGAKGNWWSQTTLGANSARFVQLTSTSGELTHSTAPEENGFSIRCMRDL